MNNKLQHYIFSVLAQLLLPLCPLGIEFWLTGNVKESTLSISAAMYTISIGVSSRNIALLGVGIVVGIVFSAVFGFISSGNTPHYPVSWPAGITICSFMLIHSVERFRRHVSKGELFFALGESDV